MFENSLHNFKMWCFSSLFKWSILLRSSILVFRYFSFEITAVKRWYFTKSIFGECTGSVSAVWISLCPVSICKFNGGLKMFLFIVKMIDSFKVFYNRVSIFFFRNFNVEEMVFSKSIFDECTGSVSAVGMSLCHVSISKFKGELNIIIRGSSFLLLGHYYISFVE